MIKEIIAKRYAKAIYSWAFENNKIDMCLNELQEIDSELINNEELINVLSNDDIKKNKKNIVINRVFKGFSKEVLNFLSIIIKKDRILLFNDIVNQFKIRIDLDSNKVSGQIYSVNLLNNNVIENIEKKVGELIKKDVALENIKDEAILGGFKVFVSGYEIDGSIKSQLLKLRKENFITK